LVQGENKDSGKLPITGRFRRLVVGKPRDLADRSIFHRLALIPFLAWVGLGADGLSSSSYGPDEAFRTIGQHTYLLIGLAGLTALTVFVIAAAYSRLIEDFPHGGGGYIVATKLIGPRAGVISGSALLVDYVMTITVSIAAAGDALFSFLPHQLPGGLAIFAPAGFDLHSIKLALEIVAVVMLSALNIRGVRESVLVLMPVFVVFLITHVIVIVGGIVAHIPAMPQTAQTVTTDFHAGLSTLGAAGMFFLLIHAYSMGGGTYTGIEAVSNGVPIMHEPRVQTAKRTMLYMAASLAFTAAGLLVCYLLWNVATAEGKTMNAVLIERMTHGLPGGVAFTVIALVSEGALLIVGAQAGFIDGPRVLANMALDSWAPRRFAALSDRLTTANGVLLMGSASLVGLIVTRGAVRTLVVMYSINVFLTFSLSMFAMARSWWRPLSNSPKWKRRLALFVIAFALCATILVMTILEKFKEGGWVTVTVTGALVAIFLFIRAHYRRIGGLLQKMFTELEGMPLSTDAPMLPIDPNAPTAAVLVASYSGLGIHTLLQVFRVFPDHFKNVVFISVGAVDSSAFRGDDAVQAVRDRTDNSLQQYLELARGLQIPATCRCDIGTDVVDVAEKLCKSVQAEFLRVTFFAGKVTFENDRWYHRLLHNETAYAIQKRLQWIGIPMVILPARLR
jgi:amino acid transporter